MTKTIEISLEQNAAQVRDAVQRFPSEVRQAIAKALDLENQLAIGHITETKLSRRGATTLGVVSNRLRSSIRATAATVSGDAIDSSIGSNVRYLGAHEFGFSGVVTVREHRAHNRQLDLYSVRGQQVLGWQLAGVGGRGKKIASGFAIVRRHQRRMQIPARAPLQTGIRERVDNYRAAVVAAVVETWEKGSS